MNLKQHPWEGMHLTMKITIMKLLETDAVGHRKCKLPFPHTFSYHKVEKFNELFLIITSDLFSFMVELIILGCRKATWIYLFFWALDYSPQYGITHDGRLQMASGLAKRVKVSIQNHLKTVNGSILFLFQFFFSIHIYSLFTT